MNAKRRKEITTIAEQISVLKEKLELIKDEEDEIRGNMPENLQSSERYEASENASNSLESAFDLLGDALDELEEIF